MLSLPGCALFGSCTEVQERFPARYFDDFAGGGCYELWIQWLRVNCTERITQALGSIADNPAGVDIEADVSNGQARLVAEAFNELTESPYIRKVADQSD